MPQNLPNEILEMVTNRLNIFDKIRLRRVSKRLRSVVVLDKNSYCNVDILVAHSQICLKLHGRLGEIVLTYRKCEDGTLTERSLGGGDKLIRGTNSKTTIHHLEVDQSIYDPEKIAHFWRSFCNWNVSKLKIFANNGFQVNAVLKVVQPTVLTDMKLEFVRSSTHTNAFSISQFVKSEQWKQLKMFKGRPRIRKSNLQHLLHLKKIDVISEVEREDVVLFCLPIKFECIGERSPTFHRTITCTWSCYCIQENEYEYWPTIVEKNS